MDPTVIGLIGILLVGLVLVATPMGRNALRKLMNAFGAKADKTADSVYNAQLRAQTIETKAEAEAQQRLRQLEQAQVHNAQVVDAYMLLQRQREEQLEIRELALNNLKQLMGDGIDDARQNQEIGMNESAALQADAKIQGFESSLQDMQPDYEAALRMIDEASRLKELVQTLKAETIRKAQVAAGKSTAGQAAKDFYHASSGVGTDNSATRELRDLESQANRAVAAANAARDTFQRVPSSAAVQRELLLLTPAARTGRIEELLAERGLQQDPAMVVKQLKEGEKSQN